MWFGLLLFSLLGVGVFAMVRREKTSAKRAFELRLRAWLAHLVGRKPGVRMDSLWRAARVSRGTVQYHLNLLERLGYIHRDREHGPARYFATAESRREAGGISLLRRGRVGELVEMILENPGRCQQELANQLNLRRKTFREYVDRLKEERLIDERRDHNKRRYYPTPRLHQLADLVGHDFSEDFDDVPPPPGGAS